MKSGVPFIRMKLDTHHPIELGEFVSAFTALASQYDKFVRTEKPDADPEATLFIKEIREGCIEADLIPWIYGAAVAVGETISYSASLITLTDFVDRYGSKLRFFNQPTARDPGASVLDLSDFYDQTAAIASVPDSKLSVAAISVEHGASKVSAVFQFDTSEAKNIRDNVARQKLELERTSNATHQRVLLTLAQTSLKRVPVGKKRTGDRGIIQSIYPEKDLALVYSSDLAEQRIKEEIRDAQENVYFKGFEVDVNVEIRNEKPIAYRITNLHDVIDLPQDE